jgi:hydrogenase maturation protein HypF
MVEMMVRVARREPSRKVVLTGGCFQNRLLLGRAVTRMHSEGIDVYWHQRVPTNDGGIALGQMAALIQRQKRGQARCV